MKGLYVDWGSQAVLQTHWNFFSSGKVKLALRVVTWSLFFFLNTFPRQSKTVALSQSLLPSANSEFANLHHMHACVVLECGKKTGRTCEPHTAICHSQNWGKTNPRSSSYVIKSYPLIDCKCFGQSRLVCWRLRRYLYPGQNPSFLCPNRKQVKGEGHRKQTLVWFAPQCKTKGKNIVVLSIWSNTGQWSSSPSFGKKMFLFL